MATTRKILCDSNGGHGSPFGHECHCNRQAGHLLDSDRPHGCGCGAPWSCEDCHDADPYMGCAGCGAVGSPGDDQSIYVTTRPAPLADPSGDPDGSTNDKGGQ